MFIKVSEILKADSNKIKVDKLNSNFNVLLDGGPLGPSGVVGVSGSTGPQGPIGPQGPVGLQGPTGQSGTTNTKWDMDKVIHSNLVDFYRILRPLNDDHFSSRIIMGDYGVQLSSPTPPSYEPQALISFIRTQDSLGGQQEIIEFPYITITGGNSGGGSGSGSGSGSSITMDSNFTIKYQEAGSIPTGSGGGSSSGGGSGSGSGSGFGSGSGSGSVYTFTSVINQPVTSIKPITYLTIESQIPTTNFEIDQIKDINFLSEEILTISSNDIRLTAQKKLIFENINDNRNIFISGNNSLTFNAINEMSIKTINTASINDMFDLACISEKDIVFNALNATTTNGIIFYGKNVLVGDTGLSTFNYSALGGTYNINSSQNLINSNGLNVNFDFTNTSKLISEIGSFLDSDNKTSLKNTQTGFITVSSDKFYTEIDKSTSTQTVFFSDVDGDNLGTIDFLNIMEDQAGGISTGDGILFRAGEEGTVNVDYSAPNFGTTDRQRTLADSYRYVSQEPNGVGGAFVILKGTPDYDLESVFGIGQDIFNMSPQFQQLNDWQFPVLNNEGTYYEYVEPKTQIAYVKTGDLLTVDGFIIGESSSGEHYTGSSQTPNAPFNTHNFKVPSEPGDDDDVIAIRIASPDKFPYVNSSSVPIVVDITFSLTNALMERQGIAGFQYWNPFQSDIANLLVNKNTGYAGINTVGRAADNFQISGIIPPGQNKIFLYISGWRKAYEGTQGGGGWVTYPIADRRLMSKTPLTINILNQIVSDSSQQSMTTGADKYIFRYNFKMPTDWNSYNKIRGESSIAWADYANPSGGGVTSFERGSTYNFNINYSGPAEYADWSYKIASSSTGTNINTIEQLNVSNSQYDINDIINVANIVVDVPNGVLSIPIRSTAPLNYLFRIYVTNSYTGETIIKTCKVVMVQNQQVVSGPTSGPAGSAGGAQSGNPNDNNAGIGGSNLTIDEDDGN